MSLKINYGQGVAFIPEAALDKLDRATKKDIKVLFALTSNREVLDNFFDEGIIEIADKLKLKRSDIEAAVSFWRGTGIIEASDDEAVIDAADNVQNNEKTNTKTKKEKSTDIDSDKKDGKKKVILRRSDELPKYTTVEITDILEKRAETKFLIDECQRAFGKMFNTAEVNILIGLSDYLGLDAEYILLLFAHLGKKDNKSIRNVEKLAYRMVDEGITDSNVLQEKLKFLEEYETIEGQIKAVFGLSQRAFTTKEKKIIDRWITEYKFDFDIIRRAYEITVDSTGKPSIPYAGAILDRWHAEGLTTLQKIEESIEAYKNENNNDGSFDTDEFLEAAIKHSFGDSKS